MIPISQNFLGHAFGGSHSQVNPQASLSQCPLSQAQCEQFLNFLKTYMAPRSSNSAQTGHQVASVMATTSSIPQPSPSTSTSPSCSSKFSGNPNWIPPNFSHSIFSAQVVDKHAYKSDTWILDTGATNHMVHSITQFTEITSIVQTCVYLPNGEQALVTHVGTVQVTSTLTLTGVLCVPSFSFNLISVSKLTKSLSCCLIFLGDCCFIQDLARWSMIGLGKEHNGLYLLRNSNSRPIASSFAAAVNHISSSDLWHIMIGQECIDPL